MRGSAQETGLPLLEHHLAAPAANPLLWQWQLIHCDVTFMEVTKHAPTALIRTHFLELQQKYAFRNSLPVASKSRTSVSYAVFGPSFSAVGVLHPNKSIFTVETYAILSTIKHIKEIKLAEAVIQYSNFLNVVTSL